MLDYETQKEIFKEKATPTKDLEIGIHMEMGLQNQKINFNNRKTQLVNIVNNHQNCNCNTNFHSTMTKIQSQRKGLQLNPIHRQLWTTLELQPSTKLPCKMQKL